MSRYFLMLFICVQIGMSYSQSWRVIPNPLIVRGSSDTPIPNDDIDFKPKSSLLFQINDLDIKDILWEAEHEKKSNLDKSNSIISLPTADGKIHHFRFVQYDMMEEGLAKKFPEFRTYYGVDIDNPYTNVRMDYTLRGFRAVIDEEDHTTYIEYYNRKDNNLRLVYFRHNYPDQNLWKCNIKSNKENIATESRVHTGARVGDCTFRSYRLANAATGEYTAFHGGTAALGQAAIVTAINRVNQIYEFELAVRLVLVANNINLVYTDAATDPYTNNDGDMMLGQNVTNCNSVIGSANFDIGHVFSTLGGGVAWLGVICSSSKARGVTGLPSPVGDPFYIDYVAHEMGHQFGGNHTFNSSSMANSNCDPGNNNPGTSVEPGSGTTIMAYAGICSPVNVQNSSDPYFHTISLGEIKAHVQGSANSCAVVIPFTNGVPVVTNVPNYSIPISTPFVLTGIATDPDSDPLTFCWEEIDAATATTAPTSTSTTQALFKSRIPTSNPSRYFPQLSNIIANTTNIWEVLPTVSRDIKFRLTVRDRRNNLAGCSSNDDVTLTSVASAGPFVVNVMNAASNPALLEGQTFSVSWSVANTNIAPISATNVDIFLSKDGGLTYPIVLATAVPNDGTHDVLIPVGTSSTCRIMVKASNNVFFDINNTNFAINTGGSTYTMSVSPSTQTVCNSTSSTTYSIVTTALGGYMTPINLSLSNVPSGVTATLSSTTINPGQSTSLVLNNYSSTIGNFNITVTGTSGSIIRNEIANFVLITTPSVPSLISPINNVFSGLNPTLNWSSGASFDYQVANNSSFTSIVASGAVTTNSVTLATSLLSLTTYYWRVRANNSCGQSTWSSTGIFQTENITCVTYVASAGLPLSISGTAVDTVNAFINIKDKGTITDVNITNMVGTHTYISDLILTLKAPNSGGSAVLVNQPCDNEANFNIKFDDAAINTTLPCPLTDGLIYKPVDLLSTFNNLSLKGNWNLEIRDVFAADGGALSAWSLQMCASNFCRLEVQNNNTNGIGSLFEAINCASANDTISFASTVNNTQLNLGLQSLVINKNLTILANPSNNISMISTSTTSPTISINAGSIVKIIGLKIIGSANPNAGILNKGTLTLTDVEVLKTSGTTPSSLLKNESGGTCRFIGNSRIKNL